MRVTVKVNGVVPPFPSGRIPFKATIDTPVSSLTIVPWAVAVAIAAVSGVGAESVTANVSSGSTTASPLTRMVIVRDSTPGSKVTVPVSVALPEKSEAVGRIGTAARDCIAHDRRAAGVARSRDGEGERRGAVVPLGLVRVGRP